VADLGPEPSSNEAALWLAKAADDLAVAQVVQASPIGANWAACFHARQTAEKALKALLVLLGIDFPRTHVLERIADLLPPDLAASFDREAIILSCRPGRSLVATPRTSAIPTEEERPRSCTRHEQS
jgi:HEPN domain-containing protein